MPIVFFALPRAASIRRRVSRLQPAFAEELVTNPHAIEEWKSSTNTYDWLGAGIYFWEYAPGRAWQWARESAGNDPAVVAAEIKLDNCLDLGDTIFTDLLLEAYNAVSQIHASQGWELPRNRGKQQKLRILDRTVIDMVATLAETKGTLFQTVRCPFEEGESVYPGGMIKHQSHIQIAVRDRACISSPIFLVDPREG